MGEDPKQQNVPPRRQSLYTGQLTSTRGATLSVVGLSNRYSTKLSRYISRAEMPTDMMERLVWRIKKPDGSIEPADFDDVILQTKFGIFQIYLLFVCGMVFGSYSCSASALSFIIPASGCQLDINLKDKGVIESAPLGGMIVGIFVWGPLADSKGRKPMLLACLMLDAVASILCAFCINKWMLLSFRIINGFGIIGACSLVFAYMGEFLDDAKRDALLASMEIFWILGLCYVPCIAWLVLPMKFSYSLTSSLKFESWNLLCLLLSCMSIISFIMLLFLPESPRFLMSVGKLDKAFLVVQKMYIINTRKDADSFPVVVLSNIPAAHFYFEAEEESSIWSMIGLYFKSLGNSIKQLLSTKKHAGKMIQTCAVDFCGSFSYITIVLWLPTMLHKWHDFVDITHISTTTLCHACMQKVEVSDTPFCQTVQNQVYLHTLTVAASTLPAVILLLILVSYINKKLILFFMLLFASGSALALNFANTEEWLLCSYILFESFSSMIETVVLMIAIAIFPVQLRGTAIALAIVSGRLGAVTGTVVLGTLLGQQCLIPLNLFVISFVLAAIITLTFPKLPQGYCAF